MNRYRHVGHQTLRGVGIVLTNLISDVVSNLQTKFDFFYEWKIAHLNICVSSSSEFKARPDQHQRTSFEKQNRNFNGFTFVT